MSFSLHMIHTYIIYVYYRYARSCSSSRSSIYVNKIPGFLSRSRRCWGDFQCPSGPAVTKKRGAGNPFCNFHSWPQFRDNEFAFQLNWPLFARYFHGSYVFHYANGNGLFSTTRLHRPCIVAPATTLPSRTPFVRILFIPLSPFPPFPPPPVHFSLSFSFSFFRSSRRRSMAHISFVRCFTFISGTT